MAGWNAYTDLGITAGATKVAIFGHNGAKWAGSPGGEGVKEVRNIATLVADVKAHKNSSEMFFDGKKFMALGEQEGVAIGKGGEEACGCVLTANTIIIAIVNGPPQAAIIAVQAVAKAVKAAGQ